jgi:hypothetical protein
MAYFYVPSQDLLGKKEKTMKISQDICNPAMIQTKYISNTSLKCNYCTSLHNELMQRINFAFTFILRYSTDTDCEI